MKRWRAYYSDHLKDEYPVLTLDDVTKIFKQHGLDSLETWEDLKEDYGTHETYTSQQVLDFLGY